MMENLFYLLTIICFVRPLYSIGILFPRQSETREVSNLDGLWKFSTSPKETPDIGFTEQWYNSFHEEWIDMPVPSSFNDITVDASIRDFVGWAWYQREFFTPARWKSDNLKIFIRFGDVHYESQVWINGQLAVTHSGGHLPFLADITDFLRYDGPNLVTVALNNTLTAETIPEGSVTYPNDASRYPPGYSLFQYNFDFFNFAGIQRTVYLYTTPFSYIDDITINTDVIGSSGTVDYEVAAFVNDTITFQCEVSLFDGSELVGSVSQGCSGHIEVANAKLWWPVYMSDTPGHLYTLQVTLQTATDMDVYRLPIGIRTVRSNNGSLLINGKSAYMHGVCKHEDSNIRGKGLDYPLLARDYNLLRWLSANVYRTSHYPYAEEALDIADRKGIMIVGESPAVAIKNFGAQHLETHKKVMTEFIQRDKNRPSVIIWSLSNEATTSNIEAGPYYRDLVEHVKNLDNSRLVGFVTNQGYNSDQAAQYMDIIGVNRYAGWYTDSGHLDLIAYQMEKDFTQWIEKFGKLVFISEYGADTIPGFHDLPSSMWTEDYQVDFLGQYFQAFDILRRSGYFVGEMIWNFADFATAQGAGRAVGNHKGIFTRERTPKKAAYMLKDRYENIAQSSVKFN